MEPSTARASVLVGRDGSYALLEVIGRGAYGTVYKGIWREVGKHVAVKRVSRSRLSPDEDKALQAEIQLFKNLKDTHIVNYIEAVDDPNSEYLDIVMEFVEGGSLHNIVEAIRRSKDRGSRVFDEAVVADYVRQVVLGLQYLHKQGVVHRDIKGANILVTKESHVKLADFGVASTKPGADMSNNTNPMDVAGSPYWMAPEIIRLDGASTASDIWSLACTVIELLTGFPPYYELSDMTALFRIVSDDCPPLPPNLSTDCEDFLRKCFNKDVNARATTDELLQHRWLAREDESGNDLDPNLAAYGDEADVQPSVRPAKGKSSSSILSKQSDISANTQTSLGMYEEEGDEDFDDLDFGEEDDADGITDGTVGLDANEEINTLDAADVFGNDTGGFSDSFGYVPTNLDKEWRRVSNRDDPFQDIMEDPEVDRERERLRKQKEHWELVKTQAMALGKKDDVHIAACKALVEVFNANPEQRYYLIYDPGLLPLLEVLESGSKRSPRVIEAMLEVTLSLLEDSAGGENGDNSVGKSEGVGAPDTQMTSFGYPRVSDIREDVCLAGFLPVIIQYCQTCHPLPVRLLASRFLDKVLRLERTRHMFIACRGFRAFVDLLEPDIVLAGELSTIALEGIDILLSMENQRHKRDFCRRFAWNDLLERITDGLTFNMDLMQKLAKEGDKDEELRDRVQVHVIKLARLLQTFGARADPTVKARMIKHSVLYPIIRQIANRLVPEAATLCILCSVRDLSRDPQTHAELQSSSAIETLVEYLSIDNDTMAGTKAKHFIISSLHNLCIVSPGRQEAAAQAGLVPHLQRYIRSQDVNLKSLCTDMYSGLACAGPLTRVELSKHSGVEFYIDLLVLLSAPGTVRKWQARVLQSLSEWLDDASQSSEVENRLVLESNRVRVCQSLAKLRITDVVGVLEPYLKMVTISDKVNLVFGASRELVSAMVRWLEKMYHEDSGPAGGGPRGRLLLLRTLLAHARKWTKESDIAGLIAALRLLLTEVVLVTDEAITVREQASLLLSALDRTGVGLG